MAGGGNSCAQFVGPLAQGHSCAVAPCSMAGLLGSRPTGVWPRGVGSQGWAGPKCSGQPEEQSVSQCVPGRAGVPAEPGGRLRGVLLGKGWGTPGGQLHWVLQPSGVISGCPSCSHSSSFSLAQRPRSTSDRRCREKTGRGKAGFGAEAPLGIPWESQTWGEAGLQ